MEARIERRRSWESSPRKPACDWYPSVGGTCARARNAGAAASSGRVLCFVDADTIVPENTVHRILQLHEGEGRCLVLYRLVSREPGIRAWMWWTFWGLARHLPLARAKCDAGVHELRSGALRDLRPLRRVFRHRRGMAADRRGVPVSPRALSLRSQPHRAHVEPAHATSPVRLRANISGVDVGRAVPLGAHLANRSRSAPEERSHDARRPVFVERIYFSACLALGRLLRSARYSKTRIVCEDGERRVRKHRAFYAPLLIWMGGGLMKLLDTGVRVLPRREWEERERLVWRLYGSSADSIRQQ